MSSWIDVLNKFLERTPLFPAGGFAAATILLLHHYGYLADLRDPISWVAMFGIFCMWVTIFVSLQPVWKSLAKKLANAFYRWRTRSEYAEKMGTLTNEQMYYLVWLRANDKRQFQAWDLDDCILALRCMGLILAHENLGNVHSRYEIPYRVWQNIRQLDDSVRKKLPDAPPWEQRLRGRRI